MMSSVATIAAIQPGFDFGHGEVQRQPPPTPVTRDRSSASNRSHSRLRSLRNAKDSTEDLHLRNEPQPPNDPRRHDSSSGQKFRVGNVGNNGLMYLRPVSRHVPLFTATPITPPDSAGQKAETLGSIDNESSQSWLTQSVTVPPTKQSTDPAEVEVTSQTPVNLQARQSYTTSNDDDDFENLNLQGRLPQVVIDGGSTERSKNVDNRSLPMLAEICIPHYRLGTPRFSAGGSAVLSSSIYTESSSNEEVRTSAQIQRDYAKLFPAPPGVDRTLDGSRQLPAAAESQFLSVNPRLQRRTVSSELLPLGLQRPASDDSMRLYMISGSDMDDPSLLRLSISTGQVVAASPSRLIGQITSPKLLDYELLSDFFLTFRSFLTTFDLATQLIARLRWAVTRFDGFGRVIRVRTFVALRHWILNYFADDFVADYALRLHFCDMVNRLCSELRDNPNGAIGDLKILNELKKCWRRTCALFWDVEEARLAETLEEDILPGGHLGSRLSHDNGNDRPQQPASRRVGKPLREALPKSLNMERPPRDKGVGWWFPALHTEGPHSQALANHSPHSGPVTAARMSDQSTHVLSCSIPTPALHKNKSKSPLNVGPRPAAASPSAWRGPPEQPDRPQRLHKRSGSFSDALRDDRAPLPVPRVAGHLMAATTSDAFPGRLIRGAVFQPFAPYVLTIAPTSPTDQKSHFDFDLFEDSNGGSPGDRTAGVHPGVKKLLGSMRRVLSAKPSNSQDTPERRSESGLKRSLSGAGSRRSKSSARINPGVPRRKLVGGRATLRVDILAARVAESYKQAVKADLDPRKPAPAHSDVLPGTASRPPANSASPFQDINMTGLNSGMTMGSRSVLIMDDTGEPASNELLPPNFSGISHITSQQLDQALSDNQSASVPVLLDTPDILDYRSSYDLKAQRSNARLSSEPDQEFHAPTRKDAGQVLTTSPSERTSTIPMGSLLVPGSLRPRKYASYHSGMEKNVPRMEHEVTPTMSESSMSLTDDSSYVDRPPKPQLRRRPGGDLKAFDRVHELGEPALTSSMGSIGSRTPPTMIPSRASSAKAGITANTSAPTARTSEAVVMLETHSSQPVLRPSFELEVQKLAQLPDSDEDGGRESALLKLEGRDKSPVESSPTASGVDEISQPDQLVESGFSMGRLDVGERFHTRHHREEEIVDRVLLGASPVAEDQGIYQPHIQSLAQPSPHLSQTSTAEFASRYPENLEESYTFVPILERGSSPPAPVSQKSSTEWLQVSLPQAATSSYVGAQGSSNALPNNADVDLMNVNDDNQDSPLKMPQPPFAVHRSFLLGVQESLSSAISHTSDDTAQQGKTFFDDNDVIGSNDEDHLATIHQPLIESQDPEVSPLEMPCANLRQSASVPDNIEEHFETRKSVPVNANYPSAKSKSALELRELQKQPLLSMTPTAAHLPMILSYSSLLLAQQFTLLEKDALQEVDWRELIELRWRHSTTPVLDWVEFLTANNNATTDQPLRGGVDVCVARFNLVVKWALSEIMLTQDIGERVACIVKFIHVAQHCRRMRNWATMYQITLALVSGASSRLKQTWSEVPDKDRETLQALESLAMPMRNFHNLRAEMETVTTQASNAGTEAGCIPFIGLYTHDLDYNDQKPAYVSKPGGASGAEALINFEKHHTAAMIVKNLLRLLEASSRYNFQPVPEVISRCLWISALSDEDIASRSRELEP